MEDRKREEVQEEQKEKTYVTRREFYICFVILLAVIFWNSHGVESKLEQQIISGSSNASAKLDHITSQIYGFSSEIEEADNPLQESNVQIADVDMQKKTVTLCMKTTPKEYQDGMRVKFFLSCDGAEAIEVPASVGKDRTFAAEAKLPFCGEVSILASLQKGDTEWIRSLGVMTIEEQVLPYFSGNWNCSVSWQANQKYATIDGEIYVDIQKPDWMMAGKKSFDLKNEKVEVCIDGKRIKTIPAEILSEDSGYYCYQASISEKDEIKPKEGQTIEFIFKAEDNNGLKYSYLVERGRWNQEDGYIAEEPAISEGAESNSRLTVE